MPSGGFRKGLQDKLLTMMQTALTTDIKLYASKLHDGVEDLSNFPMLAVNVRQKSQKAPGEIGTLKELWEWEVAIYYLDIQHNSETDSYEAAEARRDGIIDIIETTIERNYNLNGFSLTSVAGNTETVYDTNFRNIIFDSSGQEDYYTFVSELYLTVDTQRN